MTKTVAELISSWSKEAKRHEDAADAIRYERDADGDFHETILGREERLLHIECARVLRNCIADLGNVHRAEQQRINSLIADLEECREFIEGYADVNDGDYGIPTPNRAMSLCNSIDEAIYGPGGY